MICGNYNSKNSSYTIPPAQTPAPSMKEENIKVRDVAKAPPPDIPEIVIFELTV